MSRMLLEHKGPPAQTKQEEIEPFLHEGEGGTWNTSHRRAPCAGFFRAFAMALVCLGLPFLLLALLLPPRPGNRIPLSSLKGKDWLSDRVRPFFINIDEFWNSDMPLNSTVEPCDMRISITNDKEAASLFIANIYTEEANGIDHSVDHWQPTWTPVYDVEENPVPIFEETKYNHSKGLNSWYDFRWTYEFDAPITYTYYQISDFKDLRAPPIPFQEKLQEPIAVDFASNCNAVRSNRLAIVEELHSLLPGRIYSYGVCNHNRDVQDDAEDLDAAGRTDENWQGTKFKVLQKAKFYLAFESATAVDYVTEKYWHALAAGVVPVYLGAPNLREHFLPHPKAAIIASEFETVKDLATHLEYLAGNETAYNEHLEWKALPYSKNFQTLVDYEDSSPPLCKVAKYTRGKFTNPLNRFKTAEKYGNVTTDTPRITSSTWA